MSANDQIIADHSNVLTEARKRRLGIWIERICKQARTNLCGQGVKNVSDIADKVINALPSLTGAASYAAWDKAISPSSSTL